MENQTYQTDGGKNLLHITQSINQSINTDDISLLTTPLYVQSQQ